MSTENTTPAKQAEPQTKLKKFEEGTLANVLNKITDFVSNGDIKLPPNYVPENAVRSAYLMLQDAVDKNNTPVLEACTKESIANALLKMVVQGMSAVKSQCYFIAYGNKLTYQRSYFGSELLAKRVDPTIKDIKPFAIYKDDVFEYVKDLTTGITTVTKHQQSLDTIDPDAVKGAYCLIIYKDGRIDTEIMTKKQIDRAWAQGKTKGESPAHKNFGDEMAEKTVVNRACKAIINASDDSDLMQEDEIPDVAADKVKHEIGQNANRKSLTFTDAVVVGELDAAKAEPVPVAAPAAEKQTVHAKNTASESNVEGLFKQDKPEFD